MKKDAVLTDITNYYLKIPKQKVHNPNKGITHNLDIPFYMLVIGGSGSGKTNTVLDMIHRFSNTFNRIAICLKNQDEPLYNFLAKKTPDIEFYESIIPDIDSFEPENNNLIIFDDLVLDKSLQNQISEYFIRGRKRGLSCIYISQVYYSIPKKIRVNARYILLKKLSSIKDLKLILSEYNMSNDLNDILQKYNEATSRFTDFLLIDTVTNRYGKNYDF